MAQADVDNIGTGPIAEGRIRWLAADIGGDRLKTLKWYMEEPAYVVTVEAESAEDALRKIEVDIVPELRRQVDDNDEKAVDGGAG